MAFKKIRSLKPEEIEIRVNQITSKGAQLLLYKDSRCDKRILDETFGITGWKNRYEEVKGNLFCTISIWDDEKKEWIDKCDCGAETFSEKEKGEASDAFKRAGFNVGIGRELYTRIFYFANVPTVAEKDKNGKDKYKLSNSYEKFRVLEITTNEDTEKIEAIKIVDSNNKVVFTYPTEKKTTSNSKKEEPKKEEQKKDTESSLITPKQKTLIQTLLSKFEDRDEAKKELYDKFNITTITTATIGQAKEMIDYLQEKVK